MSNTTADFVFGINIPVNIPREEEINAISDSLEDSIMSLVGSGYMTLEEAVAYVKFSTQLASFVPFMLDGFLKSYRANMEKLNSSTEVQS